MDSNSYNLVRRVQQQSNFGWSALPVGLLYEIMGRLVFVDDYVRFGAVCVSWRIAFVEDRKKKDYLSSSSLPLLLIPLHGQEQISNKGVLRSLYSVSEDKVCNLQVKVPYNKFCRGSNFGWLVTMQRESKHGYNNYVFHLQLHNPLLSIKHNIINLPSLDKVVKNDGDDHYKPFLYLRKAVLSSDPLFTPNEFVVMSIISRFSKLVFYARGDKDWTPIEWENEEYKYFDDVIYFNKTQQFYSVMHKDGAVLGIELNKCSGGDGIITPKLTQVPPPTEKYGSFGKKYLVETSTGELLQVIKEIHSIPSSHDDFVMTVKFKVFKLDSVGGEWNQTYNIGNTILFLGDNCSISRSATDCPGCKPNSIYYTDNLSFEQQTGRLYGSQDTGIYNLEDGTIQPHYPMASKIIFPTPIWFEPTMGRCN